jgi:hypothetical protein
MKLGRALLFVAAIAGMALGFACGKYESCDPGQVLQFNVCFPSLADGGFPDAGAGGAPGGTCNPVVIPDGGAAMCTGPAPGFGDPCTSNDQCHCGKDLCAVIPGQTCGFCTLSNCMANPSICPTGWRCFDASAWQAGYSLCVNF